MSNRHVLHVVSQTHWDREWYGTFQRFRRRLVFLIDELVEHLESDPGYRVFHMDGQTIVLEDYLAIRPQMRDRLTRLIVEGRIVVGPWYVMPDEFLVSGESLVRNLQRGGDVARSFGVEPMSVGYIVDIFGHASQMPAILRGFGIDSAVLFRGAGDYPQDTFWWVGADGSEVLTAKLDPDRCYSNFYFAVRWPFDGRGYGDEAEVKRRVGELVEMMDRRAISDNLLMMDGVDHIEIEPELPKLMRLAQEAIPDSTVHHARLEDYFLAQREAIAEGDLRVPSVGRLDGRLYSIGRRGLNNRVLKNTLSSMVHLKQANDACETLLTRYCEPILCLIPIDRAAANRGFLDEAWRFLLENHPHDSICGCSIAAVHEDNQHRFKQCREIAEDLLRSAHRLAAPSGQVTTVDASSASGEGGRPATDIYNAGQRPIEGLVEVDILIDPARGGNLRIYDREGKPVTAQVLHVEPERIEVKTDVRRLPAFHRYSVVHAVFPGHIPALGFARYSFEQIVSRHPGHGEYSCTDCAPPHRPQGSLRVGPQTWRTDRLVLSVTADGRPTLTDLESGRRVDPLFTYEDGGDVGDGWNHVRPPAGDEVCTSGAGFTTVVESDGPHAVRVRFDATLRVPARAVSFQRGREKRDIDVSTTVTLVRDRSLVSVRTVVTNSAEDHRMRVLVPVPAATRSYYHTTPFALDRSEIGREDDTDSFEPETGVVPNQGVVVFPDESGPIGLYNRGLYELEVIDGEPPVAALTLFRAFRTEGGADGQLSAMLRTMEFEWALDFGTPSDTVAAMAIRGSDWRAGTRSFHAPAGEAGEVPVTSVLAVEGDVVLSSVRRLSSERRLSSVRRDRDGTIVVRAYNPVPAPTEATFHFGSDIAGVEALRLDERSPDTSVVPVVSGREVRVAFPPSSIRTLAVRQKE